MKVIKVEAELVEKEPIMFPEPIDFPMKDGTIKTCDGMINRQATGRYILTYENGSTEIVEQERAEQERRALLGSFAAAQAEAIRQAQQGA